MTTADDAAREAVQGLAAAYRRDGMEDAALAVESFLARRREQRPDVTQREAVARAIWDVSGNHAPHDGSDATWGEATHDAKHYWQWAVERAYTQADAALSAITPVQPDPLRAGVEALAGDLGCEEFDGTLDLDGLRALDRLRVLLETETTVTEHYPVIEDCGPPWGEVFVCAANGEAWPCAYERDLAREEPPR